MHKQIIAIKLLMPFKKFNTAAEIMLYKCHGIRKYTSKRSQM